MNLSPATFINMAEAESLMWSWLRFIRQDSGSRKIICTGMIIMIDHITRGEQKGERTCPTMEMKSQWIGSLGGVGGLLRC